MTCATKRILSSEIETRNNWWSQNAITEEELLLVPLIVSIEITQVIKGIFSSEI